jgi:peroxiredoxin Q/BCP
MTARSLVAVLLLAGVALPAVADDSKLKVKAGDKFPDVPLSAAQIEKALPDKQAAKTVSVGDLKGKTLVMFFYPKANTGG